MEDSFEAVREAKNRIRNDEADLLQSSVMDRSTIYRLLESVCWSASATNVSGLAANLVQIFQTIDPEQVNLNGQRRFFGESLYDVEVDPKKESSEFWNIRLDSAQVRGASSSFHNLLDFTLKTVETGFHPLDPDPVSFIVGEFSEDSEFENPQIQFPIEIFHRSARVTVDSTQFVSINEKVVWIDDSSGRMGVVGGEPLSVIGQPEGTEPALRIETDGEEYLQPFDSINLMDGDLGDE